MASNSQQNIACYTSHRHRKTQLCSMSTLLYRNVKWEGALKHITYTDTERTYFKLILNSTLYHKWNHFLTGSLPPTISPISMLKENILRVYLLTRNVSPSVLTIIRHRKVVSIVTLSSCNALKMNFLHFPKWNYSKILMWVKKYAMNVYIIYLPITNKG